MTERDKLFCSNNHQMISISCTQYIIKHTALNIKNVVTTVNVVKEWPFFSFKSLVTFLCNDSIINCTQNINKNWLIIAEMLILFVKTTLLCTKTCKHWLVGFFRYLNILENCRVSSWMWNKFFSFPGVWNHVIPEIRCYCIHPPTNRIETWGQSPLI